ncbi:MAG TPA: tetratricopeptide repeat protein [bacterium]|nr:tetratricopeptide repeat protein [bacterium]HPN41886.1 tetratricopeptide repeat protein [bacterium]
MSKIIPFTINLPEAMDLMDTSQLDELMQQLEESIKKNPKDVRSLLMLGNGYYMRGKISAAIKIFEKAIQVNPNLPYAYYYLGISHYRQLQLTEAKDALKKVIELSPEMLMAYYWLGITYWHLGKFAKARLAFETLLEKNQDSPVAHYQAALSCIEEQCYDDALQHLEALTEIGKNDSRLFYHLGMVYYRLHRVPEAIKAYKKALELSPNNNQIIDALKYLTDVQEP